MNCLNCGCKTNNPKFCSKSCSASFNNKGVRRHGSGEDKACLNCGKINYDKKYCSNKCQGEHKRKNSVKLIEKNELMNWKSIKRYLMDNFGKCDVCGISEWQGNYITLECDHIDGDITNNILSNSRLLCPNCHSQTHTYRSKNIHNPNGKEKRRERYLKSLKEEI
jgi:hypothetical protein